MLSYTVASQHLKKLIIEGLNYVRIKFRGGKKNEDTFHHSSHHFFSTKRFETLFLNVEWKEDGIMELEESSDIRMFHTLHWQPKALGWKTEGLWFHSWQEQGLLSSPECPASSSFGSSGIYPEGTAARAGNWSLTCLPGMYILVYSSCKNRFWEIQFSS